MILVDAGPLVAVADPRDPARAGVVEALGRLPDWETLAVPAPVIPEVAHFISRRVGTRAESAFLRAMVSDRFEIMDPEKDDYVRAAHLVEQYAGFPLGTVDALIVAMAERLGVTTILTLDRRHFGAIRPAHCEAFELVP